ncbi:MAG TPA: hypothetical protein VK576_11740, partial [Thermoleophilia bacterium]|nr:hypothetical protein [Thermoleophilia bacterium]
RLRKGLGLHRDDSATVYAPFRLFGYVGALVLGFGQVTLGVILLALWVVYLVDDAFWRRKLRRTLMEAIGRRRQNERDESA